MKMEELGTAASHLSADDQEMLSRLGEAAGENGVAVALDMNIRHGLTTAMGEMGQSIQLLLNLLTRCNITLPEHCQASYDALLRDIAGAASSGAVWVTRSRQLDESALLALAPETCPVMQ